MGLVWHDPIGMKLRKGELEEHRARENHLGPTREKEERPRNARARNEPGEGTGKPLSTLLKRERTS